MTNICVNWISIWMKHFHEEFELVANNIPQLQQFEIYFLCHYSVSERKNSCRNWIVGSSRKLYQIEKIAVESFVIWNGWTSWCYAGGLQCNEWFGCDSNGSRISQIYQKVFPITWSTGKWYCVRLWWTLQQQTVNKTFYMTKATEYLLNFVFFF